MTKPPTHPRTHHGVAAGLEILGLLLAGLCGQAVVRVAFDRDAEPLWGLFHRLVHDVTGQLVLVAVIGAAGAVLASWGHLRRQRASRPAVRPSSRRRQPGRRR